MDGNAPVGLERLLDSGRFTYGVELITTRGRLTGESDRRLRLGEEFSSSPRIAWISITDNPGGYPMIPAESLARVIKGRKAILIHLSCRDRNRTSLESAAWEYASEGFNDILAVSGDYPRESFGGSPAPVFDLDATGLLAMLTGMNAGLETHRKGKPVRLPATSFHAGCAVSPFKKLEQEVMGQYLKLLRKVRAGARFVFPQFGFDMRKAVEPVRFLAERGIRLPFIGNAYVLTRGLVEVIRAGEIPGCVISDDLYAYLMRHGGGPDRGRAFFLELAARQLAAFREQGFASGYVGGVSSAEEAEKVFAAVDSFTREDGLRFAREIRYPVPGEFHLYAEEGEPARPAGRRHRVSLNYRLSRRLHNALFVPDGWMFGPARWVYGHMAPAPGRLYGLAHCVERGVKAGLYGCRDCGDCSLPECGFLCPIGSCPKHQRNGPCGGSKDGRGELKDRPCMWVDAYDRLSFHGEAEATLGSAPFIPDSSLIGTSSWANALTGRGFAGRFARRAEGH